MANSDLPSKWRALRSRRQLHPAIQVRLKDLFGRLVEDGFALPEGYGVALGHRSDLVLYLQSRKAIHFELFASKGMVERDVNMLLMSQADVRVSIILDESVDASVATAYFRTVGDNRFVWHWASDFLDDSKTDQALQTLRSLLDEARSVGGPLVESGPDIIVNPASGPPFTKVSVTAAGFHPRQDLDIFWDPDGLTTHITHVYGLNDEGGGHCEGFIPHSLMAPVGKHSIRAIDTLGNSALASFDVTVAWPTPSVRVVPDVAHPGTEVTVVGGGAPPGIELTTFLWQESGGTGVATASVDERGEFAVRFVVPWLLGGLEVLRPGRHRVSLTPTEGGPRFETHTHLEVPPFSPPDTIEWQTGLSQKSYGIAVFDSGFSVNGRDVTWRATMRNDNKTVVFIGPMALLTMVQHLDTMLEEVFQFDSKEGQIRTMVHGEAIGISFGFHRSFEIDDDLRPRLSRLVRLRLTAKTEDDDTVLLDSIYTFPFDAWLEVEDKSKGENG